MPASRRARMERTRKIGSLRWVDNGGIVPGFGTEIGQTSSYLSARCGVAWHPARRMTLPEALLVLAAGLAAGTINTVVGSGTLITFPVLLALGYAPVTANVSNNVGLVPGSLSGAIGYRRELAGQRARAIRLGACSTVGGVTGAVALLVLPASAFRTIVPVFIAIALVLVLAQP